MLSDLTLDTSGVVNLDAPLPSNPTQRSYHWSDLDPFTQGYIEALFASAKLAKVGPKLGAFMGYAGFSDLAPETLAAILKACSAFLAAKPERWSQRENGPHFWELRQAAKLADFPPLTPYLGDDGKVYLTNQVAPATDAAQVEGQVPGTNLKDQSQ